MKKEELENCCTLLEIQRIKATRDELNKLLKQHRNNTLKLILFNS